MGHLVMRGHFVIKGQGNLIWFLKFMILDAWFIKDVEIGFAVTRLKITLIVHL